MERDVDKVEAREHQDRLANNQFPDVVMHVMSQFMCQHHLDFVGRVAINHRIAHHNAARVAESHQRGIGGSGFAAHLHREDAAHASMGAISTAPVIAVLNHPLATA